MVKQMRLVKLDRSETSENTGHVAFVSYGPVWRGARGHLHRPRKSRLEILFRLDSYGKKGGNVGAKLYSGQQNKVGRCKMQGCGVGVGVGVGVGRSR